MNRIFGIDLGSTYSCIAYTDEAGKPVVLRNSRSQVVTPSVVHFEGNNVVVGQTAKELAELYPEAVTQMFKREMCNEEWSFTCEGKKYRPEELSAMVLRKLVEDVSQQFGEPITDVVITCPAWFGSNQRDATANAGKIAGLNVREIINEPTAAAISYGIDSDRDEVVLVFDLGGGTFDVTMIAITKNRIEVICTGGDHYLGGRNWDAQLVRYLAESFCQVKGGNPEELLDNPETKQDLYSKAEAAKQRLSNKESDKVIVTHDGEKTPIELSRTKFDELTASLLERTVSLTKEMLNESKAKGFLRFDRLLLVGGSTLMPQVAERLKREFNVECKLHDPHESVAKGAAIYGRRLEIGEKIKIVLGELGVTEDTATPKQKNDAITRVAIETGQPLNAIQSVSEKQIINVTSRSYGVVIVDDSNRQSKVMSTLIKRNDTVPAKVTKTYGLADDDQEAILFELVESLATDETVSLDQTEQLKTAEMQLPKGMRENAPVEVTFALTNDGRLQVFAKDLTTGRELEFAVDISSGMTAEAVEASREKCKSLVMQ